MSKVHQKNMGFEWRFTSVYSLKRKCINNSFSNKRNKKRVFTKCINQSKPRTAGGALNANKLPLKNAETA